MIQLSRKLYFQNYMNKIMVVFQFAPFPYLLVFKHINYKGSY